MSESREAAEPGGRAAESGGRAAAESEGRAAAESEGQGGVAPEGPDAELPLERYAEAAAHLVHYRKADPAEVIERLGLDDGQYLKAREAWTAAMADELSRQELALSLRFGEVFGAVKERLAADKPPLEAIGPRRGRRPLPEAGPPRAGQALSAATAGSERPSPPRGPGAEHAAVHAGDGGLPLLVAEMSAAGPGEHPEHATSAEAPAPPSAPAHVQTPTFMAHDAAAGPAHASPAPAPPPAPEASPVNPAFAPVPTPAFVPSLKPVVIVPAGAAPPEGGARAEDIVPPGMRHFTGLDSTTPVFELPKGMPLPFARPPSSSRSSAGSAAPSPSPPASAAPPKAPASAVPEGMRGFTSLTGTQGPRETGPKHPTMPFAKEPPGGPAGAASPPALASAGSVSPGGAPPPAAAAPGGASPRGVSPGSTPPSIAAAGGASQPGGPLPIERYAWLHVELAHEPANRREVLRRHGIDEQRLAQLDAYWGPRIRSEPALRAAWDTAYAAHRARLARPHR